MWWQAALSAYQAQQSKGGGGQGLMDDSSSTSSAELGVTFDSSNWTVATGGSSSAGQRPAGSSNETALWVVGAIAALALVAAIARK